MRPHVVPRKTVMIWVALGFEATDRSSLFVIPIFLLD